MGNLTDQIALGITDDDIALGSHLIHFWRNEEEFEPGARFLKLGIANELIPRSGLRAGFAGRDNNAET